MKQKKAGIVLLLCVLFGFWGMCINVRAEIPRASYREQFSESEQATFDQILDGIDIQSYARRFEQDAPSDGGIVIAREEFFCALQLLRLV